MHFEQQVDNERQPVRKLRCERCGLIYDYELYFRLGTVRTLNRVERDVLLCRSCAQKLDETLAAFLPDRFGGMP